jgi:hypothetical protein
MAAARHLQPEWLDRLPAGDPRAIRSRRDLGRLNAWMMQPGIMSAALLAAGAHARPRMMIELGAGDGTFPLRVAQRLAPHWPDTKVIMVDRVDVVGPATRAAFAALGWTVETVVADVFDFLNRVRLEADVIAANLFLHHFSQGELARLLEGAARIAPLFVACEPRRTPLARLGSRLVRIIGCNEVTRHDAVISVGAGFNGNELSALWPSQRHWQLREYRAGLFTHCFVARRTSPDA